MLRERRRLHRLRRVAQHRHEAHAFQPLAASAGRTARRASETDRAARRATSCVLPAWSSSGRGDDQRHAGVELEVRGLGPQAVLAEVVAVVADEDDDVRSARPLLVERVQHLADLGVHVADVGKVAVAHLGGLLGRERDLVRRDAADFAAVVEGDLRRALRPGRVRAAAASRGRTGPSISSAR